MTGRKEMVARSLIGGCLVLLSFMFVTAQAAGPEMGAPEATRAMSVETIDRSRAVAPPSDFAGLEATADREGRVRVIAGLRTDFTPEGDLSRASRQDQRAAIDDATARVRRALAGTPHDVVHTYETVPYIALELSPQALKQLEATEVAATVQEDNAVPATLAQSTQIVEAKESASVGRKGAGGAVAILDTGVSKSHPFLQQAPGVSKVVSEACYSANANCPGNITESTATGSGLNCTYAANGCRHGTHVAGIAAGKGNSFSGVAPEARLISIQVFSRFTGANCAGAGEDPCALSFTSDQMKGLERVFALRNTFSIGAANMSLGGGQFTSACDANPLKPIIDNLRSARIPTVIASGNDGFTNAVGAPGCISTAITVGSTGDSDQVSLFSNSSSVVDLFAPGENITSSVPGGGFAAFNGTSMATPHVAGAWTVARQVSPTATVTRIENAMDATGKPITDTFASPQITRDRIRVLSAGADLQQTNFRITDRFGPAAGLGLASDGVGLARRTPANQNPTTPAVNGTFQLTGVPAGARILRSYVVYQTVGAPDASFNFRGVSRSATLIGGSAQYGCWNTNSDGAIRTYRYVVPPGEVTGNGSYSIGGVGATSNAITGRPDGQGASLVVVFDKPGDARQGRAVLRWGAMLAQPSSLMNHSFTGLSVPTTPVAPALHVGIGDGQAASDPAMFFNGSAVTAPSIWSGREGAYWDDDRIALPVSSLPAGTTSRTNSQRTTDDCLTWAYAALTYKN